MPRPLKIDDNVGNATVMYRQPSGDVNVQSHVFVNPKHWPRASLTEDTASVFWQHGDADGAVFSTPTNASLTSWTGTRASAFEQAIATGKNSVSAPWSGVQFANGTWGAAVRANTQNTIVY